MAVAPTNAPPPSEYRSATAKTQKVAPPTVNSSAAVAAVKPRHRQRAGSAFDGRSERRSNQRSFCGHDGQDVKILLRSRQRKEQDDGPNPDDEQAGSAIVKPLAHGPPDRNRDEQRPGKQIREHHGEVKQ